MIVIGIAHGDYVWMMIVIVIITDVIVNWCVIPIRMDNMATTTAIAIATVCCYFT